MIYGLIHPVTLEIRYIGKTIDAKRRFKQHQENAQTGCDLWVYRWWRSLGTEPCLVKLSDGDYIEEIQWISRLKGLGARLTNSTDGGHGGRQDEATRKKMSQSQRTSPKALEHRRNNIRLGLFRKGHRTAVRKKISDTLKRRWETTPHNCIGRTVSEKARLAGAANLASYKLRKSALITGNPR